MYYARRRWRNLAEGMHMRHHVMSATLFFDLGDLEVLVCHCYVCFHLRDGVVGDVEAELFLRFCQPDPELAPCWGSGAREKGVSISLPVMWLGEVK
jgi:hypothetical protein